jgi:uncharacterized membrane protein
MIIMTKKQKSNTREAKKAIVMNTNRKRSVPVIAIIVAFTAVAGFGLLLFPGGSTNAPPPPASYSAVADQSAQDGQINYATQLFDDGQARHFTYQDIEGGTTIAYFILKSTDGVIRAAFDACDVCWPEGKGYVQDGAVMICRNCGRRFDSGKINDVQGGCNPAPLNRTIAGDQLIIRVEELKAGRRYFNFGQKG